MMATNQPALVRVGTVGGNPILVDVGSNGVSGGAADLVAVTLSADYVMENPPGYPFRPNVGGATPFYPRTLPSGGTYRLLKPEAAALVTAGAAAYA